jgi:uncharacterized YccA/Bax inhibitor family protein
MTNELLGYIQSAVAALLGVAVLVFGVDLSEDQIASILTAVGALGALVFAVNSRRSGGKVQELRRAAKAQGVEVPLDNK